MSPNIVLITADNQPPDLLGCYGNHEVYTPHTDRLAARGVRLDRFCCTNGMCSPGRASLITGLMPSQHGVHSWLRDVDLEQWPEDWSAVDEYPSLVTALRDADYRTVMVGKHHLGQPRFPVPGFDETVTFVRGHTEDFYDNIVVDRGREYEVKDRHIVDYFTEKAVETIEQLDSERPFFLMVNYDAPYLLPPTNLGPDPRNRFYERFVDCNFDTFPRCAISDELLALVRGPDDPTRYSRHFLYNLFRMHNDPATMASVCSQIAIVDDGVGQIIDALERTGHGEDTLIVYTADQANLYGQHGLWGHTIQTRPSHLYDVAIRIPFIAAHPSLPAGHVSNELWSQIDLPATICDLAGIEAEFPDSAGRSFADVLRGDHSDGIDDPDAAIHGQAVYFEQEETRGIRTDRYTYWQRMPGAGDSALFDLHHDPGETTSLIGDQQHASAASALRARLEAFFADNSDPAYDIWKGGQAKGSVSSESFLRPLMPPGWVATTTSST